MNLTDTYPHCFEQWCPEIRFLWPRGHLLRGAGRRRARGFTWRRCFLCRAGVGRFRGFTGWWTLLWAGILRFLCTGGRSLFRLIYIDSKHLDPREKQDPLSLRIQICQRFLFLKPCPECSSACFTSCQE